MNPRVYELNFEILRSMKHEWQEDSFYILPAQDFLRWWRPVFHIGNELADVVEPFIYHPITPNMEMTVQSCIDSFLNEYRMQRAMLIWTNLACQPMPIDTIKFTRVGPCEYKLTPYTDMTEIINERIARFKLAREN